MIPTTEVAIMKRYITSDWHLLHENIVKYEGRPVDYQEKIIEGLKIVKPEDIVINLGDLIMGKNSEVDPMLERINAEAPGYAAATRLLIKGNHDHLPASRYRKHGYILLDSLTINGIYISHHGVKRLPSDCVVQIFGHYHSNTPPEVLLTNGRKFSIEEQDYKLLELNQFCSQIPKATKDLIEDKNRHKQ